MDNDRGRRSSFTIDETDPITQRKSLDHNPKESGLDPQGQISSPNVCGNAPVSTQAGSPAQSPQSYVPGRPAGYDPNRIPSAVFASKAATPMEWSVASNESLFSIHVGNNSFSRDHIFLLGKSGELPRLDESIDYPASLPTVTETGKADINSENLGKGSGESNKILANVPPATEELNMNKDSEETVIKGSEVTDASAETPKLVAEVVEAHSKENMAPAEDVRNSDGSAYSVKSFAFQVLAGESERNSSVNVQTATDRSQNQLQQQQSQQQQSQPQEPAATPKAAQSSWFSCFACCSFRG